MERLKYILLTAAVGCALVGRCAIVSVSYDPKCVAQIAQNAAAQEAVETAHNSQLKNIDEKKDKIMGYASSIALIKDTYLYTLKNIEGFGYESAFYKTLYKNAKDVIERTPQVVSDFSKASFPGKAVFIYRLESMMVECVSLVGDFTNIVCNGKIQNPLEGNGTNRKNDGDNILNRNDRLTMAMTINARLNDIRCKLTMMDYMCKYADYKILFSEIDPKGYSKALGCSSIANNLINTWKRL